MPLGQFVRFIADQSGASVIVDEGVETKLVFAELRGEPLDAVLSGVARRLGVSLRKDGSLYIMGASKPEDRAVLVRRVRRLKKEDLTQALGVFGGAEGRSVAFADGLVVVGDKVEVLSRVAQMLDEVEAAEVPVWVVQLHLVGWSRRAAEDFGFDLTPAADLAFGFAVNSRGAQLDVDLGARLDGILRVAAERNDVRISSAPMFALVDGGTGKIVQGDRVPVPRRTTTNEGTTRTEGFDYIQTGTNVLVTLREMERGKALLDVEVGMSDIRSYVEVAPITGEETFSTSAVVEAGGVYLLGSIVKDRETAEDSMGWRTNDAFGREIQVVQVWCRTYRIGAGVDLESVNVDAEATRGFLNELAPKPAGDAGTISTVSPVSDASAAEPAGNGVQWGSGR